MVLRIGDNSYNIISFTKTIIDSITHGRITVSDPTIFETLQEEDYSNFTVVVRNQDYNFANYTYSSSTEYYTDDSVRYEILLDKE